MYKEAGKITFVILFLFFLLTFCHDKKNESDSAVWKIVLVADIANKPVYPLDSIVYLYVDMIKDKKCYFFQTEYYNFSRPLTSGFYLLSDEKYLYLGISFNQDDTVTYFPYCSFTLHEEINYNINNGIEYLERGSGFTIFTDTMDLNRKEYFGTFLSLHVTYEEPAKWILDDNNRMERIQIGDFILERKKEELVLEFPKDFGNPSKHTIDILTLPSRTKHVKVVKY